MTSNTFVWEEHVTTHSDKYFYAAAYLWNKIASGLELVEYQKYKINAVDIENKAAIHSCEN